MEESEEEAEMVEGGVWGDVAEEEVVHGAGASAVEGAQALECGGKGMVRGVVGGEGLVGGGGWECG